MVTLSVSRPHMDIKSGISINKSQKMSEPIERCLHMVDGVRIMSLRRFKFTLDEWYNTDAYGEFYSNQEARPTDPPSPFLYILEDGFFYRLRCNCFNSDSYDYKIGFCLHCDCSDVCQCQRRRGGH